MTVNVPEAWDPNQYNRFAGEREKPFWDLVGLLEPVDSPSVVDLGCGDGRLTAILHERLGAGRTLGVDSSPTMLAGAAERAGEGLSFLEGDFAAFEGADVDVLVANASLHWVPDHRAVLARWKAALSATGQLAVQVPANPDHPSHRISSDLALEWLGDAAPADPVAENVLAPEEYAVVLDELGFALQHVRLQVYGHRLSSTEDVVEWVRGTSLTRFQGVLGPERFDEFVAEYRRRLLDELGERSPYFYPFKRILCWARLA